MIKHAFLLLFLSASLASAAISRVQSATNSANASATLTLTFGSNFTPGNIVLVAVGHNAGAPRITEAAGITATMYWIGSTNTANSNLFLVHILSSGVNSLTITQQVGTNAISAVGAEYTGTNIVTDMQAATSGSSTNPASGATATTSQANELWVGVACTRNTNGGANVFTAYQNGFAEVAEANTSIATSLIDRAVTLMERFVTSTGAATASATSSVNTNWSCLVLTFYESPTAAGTGAVKIPSI